MAVVVPTINSKLWIDTIADYYSDRGVDVIFYVDDKSSDGTFDFLKSRPQLRGRVRILPNRSSTRIGEAVEYFSKDAGSPWILRLDDDELPSLALLKFCEAAINRTDIDAYSFPRYQCLVSNSGRLLAHMGYSENDHRQWRLYRADRVTYVGLGHMPGFDLRGLILAPAPGHACMIHLDWALHSYAERKAKVKRYDTHTFGDGSTWQSYYLFEEHGIREQELKPLELPEFDKACRELCQRFPQLCLDEADRGWPANKNVS